MFRQQEKVRLLRMLVRVWRRPVLMFRDVYGVILKRVAGSGFVPGGKLCVLRHDGALHVRERRNGTEAKGTTRQTRETTGSDMTDDAELVDGKRTPAGGSHVQPVRIGKGRLTVGPGPNLTDGFFTQYPNKVGCIRILRGCEKGQGTTTLPV